MFWQLKKAKLSENSVTFNTNNKQCQFSFSQDLDAKDAGDGLSYWNEVRLAAVSCFIFVANPTVHL